MQPGAKRQRCDQIRAFAAFGQNKEFCMWMRRYGVLAPKIFLAIFVLLAAAPTASYAARDGARYEEIWKSEPKYYEPSGSYFQLVEDKSVTSQGVDWMEAAEKASSMTYKGRPGRLAILSNAALYGWILENFRLVDRGHNGNTWIGFRYLCSTRTLMKVSGDEHPRTAFSVWDIPWYRSENIICGRGQLPYMSVFIDGQSSRWRAAGYRKRFPHYLVEYPTE